MKRACMFCLGVLTLLILVTLSSVVHAEAKNACIYYFYGQDCDDCKAVNTYLNQLHDQYPELQLRKLEIYFNKENFNLLKSQFQAYNIPDKSQGVPAVFTSTGYFIGEKPIKELLLNHLAENNNSICPSTEPKEVIGVIGKKSSTELITELTFFSVTNGALTNYLSRGNLALISFLLSIIIILIASIKDRQKTLRRCLAFLIGSFIAYLLYGLGLFSWFGTSSVSNASYKILGIISIIISLIMIIRHFSNKNELFENVRTETQRKLKHKLDQIFSSLGMLIFGFVGSLFSFSGTHKTFGWIRYLISQHILILTEIVMLIYYLIILLLLPLLLSWIIYWVRSMGEESSEKEKMWIWKRRQLRALNLLLSILTLALGIIVLSPY